MTGVYVVDYLFDAGILQEEETERLGFMMTSKDDEMRDLAKHILLEKWKMKYPNTSAKVTSILFKDKADYEAEKAKQAEDHRNTIEKLRLRGFPTSVQIKPSN